MQVNKVPPVKQPTSTRKLQANRRNALRSTGPKTLQGKRHSRMNALKHGLSAGALFEEFVSVNENAEIHNDLRQRLRQHYKPVGAAEELEVERIACCWWKLQRASRYEDAEIRFGTLKAALGEPLDGQTIVPNNDHALVSYMCNAHTNIKQGGEVPLDLKERVRADPLLRHVWSELQKEAETLVNLVPGIDGQTRARKNQGREEKHSK